MFARLRTYAKGVLLPAFSWGCLAGGAFIGLGGMGGLETSPTDHQMTLIW
jgi:hypothetical protein